MNTDSHGLNDIDLQHGTDTKLLYKTETEKIIGFAFTVLNELGHGLNEKIYENSLTILFKVNSIAFDQQTKTDYGPEVSLFHRAFFRLWRQDYNDAADEHASANDGPDEAPYAIVCLNQARADCTGIPKRLQ